MDEVLTDTVDVTEGEVEAVITEASRGWAPGASNDATQHVLGPLVGLGDAGVISTAAVSVLADSQKGTGESGHAGWAVVLHGACIGVGGRRGGGRGGGWGGWFSLNLPGTLVILAPSVVPRVAAIWKPDRRG